MCFFKTYRQISNNYDKFFYKSNLLESKCKYVRISNLKKIRSLNNHNINNLYKNYKLLLKEKDLFQYLRYNKKFYDSLDHNGILYDDKYFIMVTSVNYIKEYDSFLNKISEIPKNHKWICISIPGSELYLVYALRTIENTNFIFESLEKKDDIIDNHLGGKEILFKVKEIALKIALDPETPKVKDLEAFYKLISYIDQDILDKISKDEEL